MSAYRRCKSNTSMARENRKVKNEMAAEAWDLDMLGDIIGKGARSIQDALLSLFPQPKSNIKWTGTPEQIAKFTGESPIPQTQAAEQVIPQMSPPSYPDQRISQQQILEGLNNFAPNTPLATQSAVLEKALNQLNPSIDPRAIMALALKETRGGLDLLSPERQLGGRQEGVNNHFNTMYQGQLINYPDLQTALLGGENPIEGHPSKGLINILNNNTDYAPYRQSGNIDDLLRTYSPPGHGNADLQTQRTQLEKLMQLFKEN